MHKSPHLVQCEVHDQRCQQAQHSGAQYTEPKGRSGSKGGGHSRRHGGCHDRSQLLHDGLLRSSASHLQSMWQVPSNCVRVVKKSPANIASIK